MQIETWHNLKKSPKEEEKIWIFKLPAHLVFMSLSVIPCDFLTVSSKLQIKNQSFISLWDLIIEGKLSWIQLEYLSLYIDFNGKCKPVGVKASGDVWT